MTATQKRTAAATAAALLVATAVYLLVPTAPFLSITPIAGGVDISWPAKTNELYSIGFTTNIVNPKWIEIYYGCIGGGAVIRSNFVLTAHPPTTDDGSCWAPNLTYTNGEPPLVNRDMHVYVSLEANQQGYFHLWTRSVSPEIPTPATLQIKRTP